MFNVSINLNDFIDDLISETESEHGYVVLDRISIFKLINEIKADELEIVKDYGSYWSGILFSEPWCDLEEDKNLSEEDIIDYILKTNIVIKNYELVFDNVSTGSFYNFFTTHSDGYGGNLPHNIETIMVRLLDAAKKIILVDLEYDRDRYGHYISYEED
jgi:hypothetical protein